MRLRQSRALALSAAEAASPAANSIYYYDRDLRSQAIKILPGEYLATARDIVMVTLLGSCVAVCLHDPMAGVGGMNHFMLPERAETGEEGVVSASARYGTYAMEVLMNDMLKQGARRDRIEAKVFGGASVLKGFGANNVGVQNAQFIKRYLQRENIPIAGEDLLGKQPRKVGYYPKFGRALVKSLEPAGVVEVDRMEEQYLEKLRAEPVAEGAIEMFGT